MTGTTAYLRAARGPLFRVLRECAVLLPCRQQWKRQYGSLVTYHLAASTADPEGLDWSFGGRDAP